MGYLRKTRIMAQRTLVEEVLETAGGPSFVYLSKRVKELCWRLLNGGGCYFATSGRGDCYNYVGLPGRSIPGRHDGYDDTVDHYGKPNGWCWSCWKSRQLEKAQWCNRMLRQLIPHKGQCTGVAGACTCGVDAEIEEAMAVMDGLAGLGR